MRALFAGAPCIRRLIAPSIGRHSAIGEGGICESLFAAMRLVSFHYISVHRPLLPSAKHIGSWACMRALVNPLKFQTEDTTAISAENLLQLRARSQAPWMSP